MQTLHQKVGEIITRARVRQGIRADVGNDTSSQFRDALTALRAELGDDAILEWVLRETILAIDAENDEAAETERVARQRFGKFFESDDKPRSTVDPRKFFQE